MLMNIKVSSLSIGNIFNIIHAVFVADGRKMIFIVNRMVK